MISHEEWLEMESDVLDDETGEVVEGRTLYCMLAVCSAEEYQLIKTHFQNTFATVSHGKHPVTGEWDSRFSLYNLEWKTPDSDEFVRLGGKVPVSKAHGYDTHPAHRRK